ncbi:MAG: hypothetical protein HN579_02545 [Gammaproteobacteria bacterium]|nr:hypothetical protein [Gammaproteobacteria bacterium]
MKNKLVVQYAGFWRRLAATLIDSLLIALVMLLMLLAIYGAEYFEGGAKIKSGCDLLLQLAIPLLLTVWFWRRYLGTPGKSDTKSEGGGCRKWERDDQRASRSSILCVPCVVVTAGPRLCLDSV